MTQTNLLMQAKAGNPVAIAQLINRQISAQGMTAKVARKQHHLQILLESAECIPSKKKATRYLQQALMKLDPVALTQVKLYGRRSNMATAAWVEVIDLVNLTSSRSEAAVVAPNHSGSGEHVAIAADSKRERVDHPEILSDLVTADDVQAADGLASSSQNSTGYAFWWLWLQWQMVNIKGGLLLVLALWLVSSLIFFGVGKVLEDYLGIAVMTSMLLGLPISLLIGGWLIGESQFFFLKQYLPKIGLWRWATFVGFGLGCALATGIQFVGYTLSTLVLFTLLPLTPLLVAVTFAFSGIFVGGIISFFQWLVLRNAIKPSYSWVLWNVFAGGASTLITLLGGGAAAGIVVNQLHRLGLSIGPGSDSLTLIYGAVAFGITWLSYHMISGVKIAKLLRTAITDIPRVSNEKFTSNR